MLPKSLKFKLRQRRLGAWFVGSLIVIGLGVGLAIAALDPAQVVTLKGEPGEPGAGPDQSNFYTTQEVDSLFSALAPFVSKATFTARYAKKDAVPDLSGIVTLSAFNAASADYLTKVELDEGYVKLGGVPTLQGYVTATFAAQNYATAAEIPKQDQLIYDEDLTVLTNVVSKTVFASNYATTAQLADYLTKPEADAKFVDLTKPLPNWLKTVVGSIVAEELASPTCEGDEVRVQSICIDRFEATVWDMPCNKVGQGAKLLGDGKDDYGDGFPDTGNWTEKRYACSVSGFKPSTHITYFQAQQACALSGKRLCTNMEWQVAALGTDPSKCVFSGGAPQTIKPNSGATCKSDFGALDMAGNVAEMTADWVQAGDKQTKLLEPNKQESANSWKNSWGGGPVGATNDGIVNVNGVASQIPNVPAVLVRGGAVGQLTKVGPHVIDASVSPAVSDPKIGFRCCRRL